MSLTESLRVLLPLACKEQPQKRPVTLIDTFDPSDEESRKSKRLVTFETLITILTTENLNS